MSDIEDADEETTYSIELTERQIRIYARALTHSATFISRKDTGPNAVQTALDEREELMDMFREAKYDE